MKHETASEIEFLIRFLDKRLLFNKMVVTMKTPAHIVIKINQITEYKIHRTFTATL